MNLEGFILHVGRRAARKSFGGMIDSALDAGIKSIFDVVLGDRGVKEFESKAQQALINKWSEKGPKSVKLPDDSGFEISKSQEAIYAYCHSCNRKKIFVRKVNVYSDQSMFTLSKADPEDIKVKINGGYLICSSCSNSFNPVFNHSCSECSYNIHSIGSYGGELSNFKFSSSIDALERRVAGGRNVKSKSVDMYCLKCNNKTVAVNESKV